MEIGPRHIEPLRRCKMVRLFRREVAASVRITLAGQQVGRGLPYDLGVAAVVVIGIDNVKDGHRH